MNEQRTKDELTTENELICEELLHWKPTHRGWLKNDGYMYAGCGTPSFTTWAEAGLIFDALQAKYEDVSVTGEVGGWVARAGSQSYFGDTGPLAIRHAALDYIKAVKS